MPSPLFFDSRRWFTIKTVFCLCAALFGSLEAGRADTAAVTAANTLLTASTAQTSAR